MPGSKRIDDDLASLAQDWMTQRAQHVSIDEVLRETKRRTRAMRWVTVIEAAVGVAAVIFVANALSGRGALDAYAWGVTSLLTLGIASMLWTVVQRRDAWRPEAIGPSDVVALELGRARSSQRIWRFNQWLSTCTAFGITAMLAWTAFGTGKALSTSIVGMWAVLLTLFAASHVLMRRRIERIVEQQRRLEALAAELESS